MGRDKATLPVGGRPLALRVADALGGAGCGPVVLVGGRDEVHGGLGLPLVADRYPGEGPLGGLLTALATSPTAWTAVVACDLPDLDGASVGLLLARRRPAVSAVLARSERGVEWLVGLWHQRSVPALSAAFDAGERAVHRAAADLAVDLVPLPAAAVRNANRPADVSPHE